MSIKSRLDRLERLAARMQPAQQPRAARSPERWQALMLKLEAAGLAAWSDDWGQWYPPRPRELRALLRERNSYGRR